MNGRVLSLRKSILRLLAVFFNAGGLLIGSCTIGMNAPPSPGNLYSMLRLSLQQAQPGDQVDIFLHELTFEPLVETLESLAERGVDLRVYLEQSTMQSPAKKLDLSGPGVFERLRKAQIEYRTDTYDGTRSGRAHSKYFLIPPKTVVTGSWNATHSGLVRNHNHLVRIEDRDLFLRYRAAFTDYAWNPEPKRRIWKKSRSSRFRACFPPFENCRPLLMDFLSSQTKMLELFLFQISDTHLMQNLGWQVQEGRRVKVYLDARGSGFLLRVDGRRVATRKHLSRLGLQVIPQKSRGLFHHKAALSGPSLLTGSLNWSMEGLQRSEENLLWIEDEQCARDFRELMAGSVPLSSPLSSLANIGVSTGQIVQIAIRGADLEVMAEAPAGSQLVLGDFGWDACEEGQRYLLCRTRQYHRLTATALELRGPGANLLDGVALGSARKRPSMASWQSLAGLQSAGVWRGCPDSFEDQSCLLNLKEVQTLGCLYSYSDTGFRMDWQPCRASD